MYPNIPRSRAHNRVVKLWHDFYESAEEVPIRDILNALDNLFFAEFQGRYSHQTEGLTMGIPAAPDVAQLYCAFEESNEPAFKNTNIFLFRRYLDDILVVLIADDKASAMEQLSILCYHKLEVIWEVDDLKTTFLDLTIMIKDGAIVFKPYRKPLNR
jgi:hypothetical protein